MKTLIFVISKTDDIFVLIQFVCGDDLLVPFVDSPMGLPKKYWEYHWCPKEDRIPISKVNWDDYNFTEEQYLEIKAANEIENEEMLRKYRCSF